MKNFSIIKIVTIKFTDPKIDEILVIRIEKNCKINRWK